MRLLCHSFSLSEIHPFVCTEVSAAPQTVLSLDVVIQAFFNRLPGLRNTGEMGEIPGTPGRAHLNPRLIFIHTLAHTASLILFQHGADANARHRCGVATQSMTTLISELTEHDWQEILLENGVSLHDRADTLVLWTEVSFSSTCGSSSPRSSSASTMHPLVGPKNKFKGTSTRSCEPSGSLASSSLLSVSTL